MADITRLELEKEYLEKVKKYIIAEIKKLDIEIEEIPKRFRKRYSDTSGGDEDLIESLVNQALSRKYNLIKMLDNCYFGKFIYTDKNINKKETFYLGKNSITVDGNILVLDWRAPISTLYYEQDLGNVEYKTCVEIHSGILNSKSQISIKNGELVDVIDTELLTKDELILPFLKATAADKMKDIVASIQKEQNQIIRLPINKNLIVQGVAGSGKTSVALHRISYLLYQYNKYKPEQFLVIGPNKCFNNYTSMVLPELDSEGINQIIFDDLLEKIKLKVKITDDVESSKVCKYKSSISYKNAIDKYLSDLFKNLNNNISLCGVELIPKELIDKYFETSIGSFKNRLNITMDKCIAYIKSAQEELLDKISKELKQRKKENPNLDISVFSLTQTAKKQLQKGCRDVVKTAFSKFDYKIINLYKSFVENIDKFDENLSNEEISEIKEKTLSNLSKKAINRSDIPALIYLNIMINEKDSLNNYVHLVIDEAQDYGLFHYYVLKKMFANSTFSIFGDLGQSIYESNSINSWEELNDIIFCSDADIIYLNKSYRITKEIAEESNKILGRISLPLANPILRCGKKVSYISNCNIEAEIAELINYNYSSIALICKTEEEAKETFLQLNKKFKQMKLVKKTDLTYNGGLCVVDVSSSKGLEFDSVIINDASEEKYSSSNLIDQKKLYVAMTRALHELKICYDAELTNTLKNEKLKTIK